MITCIKLTPDYFLRPNVELPYSLEFHELLRDAAQRCIKRILNPIKAVVTEDTVIFSAEGNKPFSSSDLIYMFIAYINKAWGGKGILTFNTSHWTIDTEFDIEISHEQDEIERFAKLKYEMYLEDHNTDLPNSLFPEYESLPFDKTPEFFRRGIILTK